MLLITGRNGAAYILDIRAGYTYREREREKKPEPGMSPVCASIDIIPLRRDKIELKSKTGYYLSAKTFCLVTDWETDADFLFDFLSSARDSKIDGIEGEGRIIGFTRIVKKALSDVVDEWR